MGFINLESEYRILYVVSTIIIFGYASILGSKSLLQNSKILKVQEGRRLTRVLLQLGRDVGTMSSVKQSAVVFGGTLYL